VGAPAAALTDVDPSRIAAAFDVNVLGPLRLAQALVPMMARAPDPIIVNVSSRLGSLSAQAAGQYADLNTSYAYRITKTAQNMLTIAMAQEFGDAVRCWAVHPGTLATGMGRPEARTTPSEAAQRLVRLVQSGSTESPRFVSLDGPTLDW
jgi:NAD(P)-dependent dehydrogenase (short-subunit alcohol dehydrogenase family)